jgi:hypothetical protein
MPPPVPPVCVNATPFFVSFPKLERIKTMLETEIKKLTAAIYELNATLEAQGLSLPTQPPVGVENEEPKHSGKSVKDVVEEAVGKPKKADKPKKEEPEPEAKEVNDQEEGVNASEHTVESVRAMALAITRKDRSKQKDIKAKLAENDAKIATDLSGDGLQVVGDWLRALKEELGA